LNSKTAKTIKGHFLFHNINNTLPIGCPSRLFQQQNIQILSNKQFFGQILVSSETRGPKPIWWKPLWIAVLLLTIASGVVSYFLFSVALERVVGGLALTIFCISIAYYIRVRPSMKVNRAIYILLGISPIGFLLWIVFAVSGIGRWLTDNLGAWPSLIIGFTAPYIIGAFIGDWIGKRRNYQLPLSL